LLAVVLEPPLPVLVLEPPLPVLVLEPPLPPLVLEPPLPPLGLELLELPHAEIKATQPSARLAITHLRKIFIAISLLRCVFAKREPDRRSLPAPCGQEHPQSAGGLHYMTSLQSFAEP
jgi:hypothetical protein